MQRRRFLQTFLGASFLLVSSDKILTAEKASGSQEDLSADLAVIGGSLGGCAAALAALRNGQKVILAEESNWIGGQLTSQAVPPDEHRWIEQFGCTRSYRMLRDQIRKYYREHYPLTSAVREADHLNPGNCGVSRLCHEPRSALHVLESMFAPYISSGKLNILRNTSPSAADIEGNTVRSVRVEQVHETRAVNISASYFLDATETGDLLPLAGVEYVTGFESQKQTGEPHAPVSAEPLNMQAPTWCFAMEYRPGENHRIDRPEHYHFWRNYQPDLTPPWPGKLFSWTYSNPRTLDPRELGFDPRIGYEPKNYNLWRYRRLIDPGNFASEFYSGGITLVNWPQNDYLMHNLYEVSEQAAAQAWREAKELSLSFFYWLQTDAPRPDGGSGWPGLRLRPDLLGTRDGLAMKPYIRESRRIKALFTVKEQHIGTEARTQLTGKSLGEVTAAHFPDSVGIGSYRIDLHPSTGGDNYIDISSLPFEIPLGSLIPRRMENLLPACKNIGTTHITNGCYRLHPVEWNIGESAALLAAFCQEQDLKPAQVHSNSTRLEEFQDFLMKNGVEIRWPQPMTTAL